MDRMVKIMLIFFAVAILIGVFFVNFIFGIKLLNDAIETNKWLSFIAHVFITILIVISYIGILLRLFYKQSLLLLYKKYFQSVRSVLVDYLEENIVAGKSGKTIDLISFVEKHFHKIPVGNRFLTKIVNELPFVRYYNQAKLQMISNETAIATAFRGLDEYVYEKLDFKPEVFLMGIIFIANIIYLLLL